MELLPAILLVVAAFAFGRLTKPTIVHWTREAQHESHFNQGYVRGRFKPLGPGLEDLTLAMHRQEGLLKAVRDNQDDLITAAKKLNGDYDEDNKTSA